MHLWSYPELLDMIPEYPWLKKHTSEFLQQNLFLQLFWQRYFLPKEAKSFGCDLMFDSDSGSISAFKPYVTLSQDLLTFEDNSLSFYKFGMNKLRLIALYFVQLASFRNADGVIFLTEYSRKKIIKHSGQLSNTKIIAHGIDSNFDIPTNLKSKLKSTKIRCNYVSPFHEYKNHKQVIEAIEILSKKGYDIVLDLVGDNNTNYGKSIKKWFNKSAINPDLINFVGNIEHKKLASYLSNTDICIFASSVETISITLMEYMKMGLPIACSDEGPMPEVLQNGGVYFNPKNPNSIAQSLETIIENNPLRLKISKRAKELSAQFSWSRCSYETFSYIESVLAQIGKNIDEYSIKKY